MACFLNRGNKAPLGGALVIMAAALAASNGLVNTSQASQDGNRREARQQHTLETFLTRDLTYAASPDESNDAAWEKIQSQLGKPAPEFTVGEWQSLDSNMKGGTIESMHGDIVVIDFWGTWCPPCRAAMPKNYEMARKYADKDVRFLGISTVRGSERIDDMAEQLSAKFPLTVDDEDKTAQAYGVQWWPYYVIVDRDGIVRAAGLRPDTLETAIQRLLELQPPREKEDEGA